MNLVKCLVSRFVTRAGHGAVITWKCQKTLGLSAVSRIGFATLREPSCTLHCTTAGYMTRSLSHSDTDLLYNVRHSYVQTSSYSTKYKTQLDNSQARVSLRKVSSNKMSGASPAPKRVENHSSAVEKDSRASEIPASEGATATAEKQAPGIIQRFKDTYKQHGKVLVAVHLATSAVWFGTFFYAAASGIDVVPFLKWIGASDSIIRPFTLPGVGNAAVAYLIYKIATPLRYTVTILGTRQAVIMLRRSGHIPQVSQDNTFRSLVRDSRAHMKTRVKRKKRKIDDHQLRKP